MNKDDLYIYISTAFFFSFYLPEYYAAIKNKNLNIYNIPGVISLLLSQLFGLIYSLSINDNSLFINYSLTFSLDLIYFLLVIHYARYNKYNSFPMRDNPQELIASQESPSVCVVLEKI